MTTNLTRQPARLSASQQQFLAGRVRAARQAPQSAIARLAAEARPVVSFAQERLWLIDRLGDHDSAYHVHHVLEIRGSLGTAALRAALDALVARHETLRTVIEPGEGLPIQRVLPPAPVDLVETVATTGDQVAERIRSVRRAPFDLQAGPVLRAELIRCAPEHHVLVLVMPHIATDGWSTTLLARDLDALYGGANPPEPGLRYRDYSGWQRDRLSGDTLRGELDHWRGQLAGQPQIISLPTDRPRPAVQELAGAEHRVEVPPEVAARVRALTGRCDVSLYMVLVAAVRVLLHAHCGQDRFIIGSTISGRDRPEAEDVVGCFVNTLALRGDLSGDPTFSTALGRERETVLAAFAHQQMPFELLVRELASGRDASRNPLAQVFVQLDRGEGEGWTLPGLDVREVPVPGDVAKFDLSFFFRDCGDRLLLTLEFATALYAPATAARLAGRLIQLLASSSATPDAPLSALELLPDEERHTLAGFNDTATPARTAPVTEVLARRAVEDGARPAVVFDRQVLTYAELDRRVSGLAQLLRSRGIGRGDLVGVFLRRGLDLPVALLAVLRAGAAYVPLNPGEPADRLGLILQDAAPALVLSEEGLDGQLPGEVDVLRLDACAPQLAAMPATTPDVRCDPADLAYVIFTSGSSGRPKGVAVPRAALTNFLGSMAHRPAMGPDDVLVAVTTPSFDIAALELFLPLLVGGRLVIADAAATLDSGRLRALIAEAGATLVQATPATWRLLAGAPELAEVTALVGGEALTIDVALPLVAAAERVWNMYGPTETTIWSTVRPIGRAECERGGSLPIGTPIDNTSCRIVDAHGRPAPIGVPGELLIGGQGLARGYHGRPGLTAERFVPDPWGLPGARLYRTGDLARRLPDGDIEFLGRNDHQVKIRGYRIETGEIETHLGRHPDVVHAVVTAHEFGPGDNRLVAYLTATDPEDPPTSAALRAHLAGKVPEYMIPGVYTVLDAFPLTPNRKVDRKALPAPAVSVDPSAQQAPRTATERLVMDVWEGVLGAPVPGVHADFFGLGGHSLLAVEVINQLNRHRGTVLAVSAILGSPTVAGLAARLDAATAGPAAAAVSRIPRDGSLRPSPAQERLWFLEQMSPGSAEYHIPVEMDLRGTLNAEALRAACETVVARHETLRTRLRVGGGGELVAVVADAGRFELWLDDAGDDPDRVEELAADEARQPFDLANDPLLRARLIRRRPDEHVLVLVLHHVAADGASLDVLRADLADAYAAALRGERPEVSAHRIGFLDVVDWQRRNGSDDGQRADLAYWRRRLDGLVPLDLPVDRQRPAVRDSTGAAYRFTVSADVAARVDALARSRSTTPFAVMLAAYQATLGAWAGTDDVAVTTAVSDRWPQEAHGLVGMFVNTVVLRADLRDDPNFHTLVDQTRVRVAEALAHQRVSFDLVVDEVVSDRDPGRLPVSPAHFALQTSLPPPWRLAGLDVHRRPERIVATRHELALGLDRREGGYDAIVEYLPALFDAESVATFGTLFTDLLRVVTADPEHRPGPFPAAPSARPRPMGERPPGRTPDGPAEEAVARVWAEVLGAVVTDAHADFFGLGGHSLLAARVRMRLQQLCAVDLPMHRFFEATTVASLAKELTRAIEADLSAMTEQELIDSLEAGI